MITDEHWQAFQLVEQEKKSYKIASEIMDIPVNDVKGLLSSLKKLEPDLFPIETEKRNLSAQLTKREKNVYRHSITSFDAIKDADPDYVDNNAVEKF